MLIYRGILDGRAISAYKPIIVRFKSHRKAEFETLDAARAWIQKVRAEKRRDAETARIFCFNSGTWRLAA